jgi:hypothetical protein
MAAGLALSASSALAADINAPLDTRPTLASEIRRGWQAGASCDGAPTLDESNACFDQIVEASNAQLTHPQAFQLGLLIAEWRANYVYSRSHDLASGGQLACTNAAIYFRWANQSAQRLGLTQSQLLTQFGADVSTTWQAFRMSGSEACRAP